VSGVPPCTGGRIWILEMKPLPFGKRLAVRMGLALCLGAAIILWAADQLSLRRQRVQLEELVGVAADRVAETVRRATRDGMLRNDRQAVNRIIENIAAIGLTRPITVAIGEN